ncbi:hypothetical protein BTO32_15245 [Marinobacter lutaoensis]|uniref:Uncharacterized protein n=1 Tax=Marinobacter lutaoensis TaxID=135739 RepID=A0A1V2DQ97_9GAMM|nr:hypothetical protein [Marinobacter lutaoensis]ONF42561.1 hypothetical protein BTO32_15245 [Marinobacter lutaoensis]
MADEKQKNSGNEKDQVDLFSAIIKGAEDNNDEFLELTELPDDVVFGGASGEEPVAEEKQTEASGKSVEAPAQRANDTKATGASASSDSATKPQNSDNVVKFTKPGKGAGTGLADTKASAEQPKVTQNSQPKSRVKAEVAEKAAAFRAAAAKAPLIRGWDAGLVKYDAAQKRLVPANKEAAVELLKKGSTVNINVLYPGQAQWLPVKFGQDPKTGEIRIEPNHDEKPQKYQPLTELPEPDRFRLSPTTTPMQKFSLSPEVESELASKIEESNRNQDPSVSPSAENKKQQAHDPSQYTPGTLLVGSAMNMVSSLLKGIVDLIKRLFNLGTKVVSNLKDQLKDLSNKRKTVFRNPMMGRKKLLAGAYESIEAKSKASVDASGVDGVAEKLKHRIQHANQALAQETDLIFQEFGDAYQRSTRILHEGLGTNEAGASLIQSNSDFLERYESRSDTDKMNVESGIRGIKQATKVLSRGVVALTTDDRLDLLTAERRQELLQTISARMTERPKSNALEESALKHAVDPNNQDAGPLQEALAQDMKPAQESVAAKMQEASAEVLEQTLLQQMQQNQGTEQNNARYGDRFFGEGLTPRPV